MIKRAATWIVNIFALAALLVGVAFFGAAAIMK